MTLPTDTPKLPKWPFLTGDAALLGLAWLIADQSRNPFAGTPLIAIVTCVVLGALCGAIPFLADYARKQDEALDDRQRSLEALSRTFAASAEQISIAANGLQELNEISHRNLKAAEQLPQKLQEKIASFKAQLDSAAADDREELEKEVATLRAGESDRLESTADKVAKAIAELTRLEAAAQKHLTAFAAVEANLKSQISNLGKQVETASADAIAKTTAALATIESKLAAAAKAATEVSVDLSATASAKAESAPSKPRKPRVEEPAPETPATPEPTGESAPVESESNPQSEAAPAADQSAVGLAKAEPAPIPLAAIPEIVAVAPSDSAQPMPAAEAPPPEEPKPVRKRAPRKPKPDGAAETALPFTSEESTAVVSTASEPSAEPAKAESESNPQSAIRDPQSSAASSASTDGLTRLFVTAYIGIGNRLFIRGEGPGLSWDKGVPLQFVSIGKWRWDGADGATPVSFKLYKNDETECTALGALNLAAGQQLEVTATF